MPVSISKAPLEPKSAGFADIKNMADVHQAALDSYLLSDHPIPKIIRIIKDDWGYMKGNSDQAVRRMLYRYKDKVIRIRQAKVASKHTKSAELQKLTAAISEMEIRLDPVRMLEDLVRMQSSRLQKMSEVEAKAPTLLEAQTKNVSIMGDLLVKLVGAQLEVGLLQRVPRKHQLVESDLSEEDRKYIEHAKVSGTQVGFLAEAMKYLHDQGIVDVPMTEVPSADGVQGS
jgi:hypothetical protein